MPNMFENAIKENNVGKVYKLLSGTSQVPIGLRNKASQTGKGNNIETFLCVLCVNHASLPELYIITGAY